MASLPKLVVITDWSLEPADLTSALAQVFSLGPSVAVQHRHPEATAREFLNEARLIIALAVEHNNPVFINGRLDVALLLGAHLHLRAEDSRAAEFRALLPAGRWISRAVHSVAEAPLAEGCDFALLSPVFHPSSKPLGTRALLGAAGFMNLQRALPCPAYALGGISSSNLGGLKGAAGAAVIGAVLRTEDPRRSAAQILAVLGG